jgi:MarR-like DNA-binding transcriptional regulator SgrR of sgrS sRNA
MKRSWRLFLAAVSLWLLASDVGATRPRYGGTLRLGMPGTIRTLDPLAVSANADDGAAMRQMVPLVFETLVRVAPGGGLRPSLAISWNLEAQGMRWRVRLRNGVRLHDGSTLDSAQVAESLRASHKEWQIGAEADSVVIETGSVPDDVPWALADVRSAVVVRRPAGELLGTGPFRVEDQGANRLTLRAHEEYWGSRAFLDSIEVESGRAAAALLTDLELGRTDMAPVQPSDRRRLSQRGLRTIASRPLQLFALVFEVHRASTADEFMRRAVAATLDRAALGRVLLQDYAEPAEAILPRWLSGYELFVLARPAQVPADQVARLPRAQRTLTLRVDPADPVARSIADRIAVDAREAGFVVTVQAPAGLAPRPDVRLLRVRPHATSPDRALAGVMATLGPRTLAYVARESAPEPGAPLPEVYRVERALLERSIIVPVVHVPDIYGLGERLESWNEPVISATGALSLADVWLRAGSPP